MSTSWFSKALTQVAQTHPQLAPVVAQHLQQRVANGINAIGSGEPSRSTRGPVAPMPPPGPPPQAPPMAGPMTAPPPAPNGPDSQAGPNTNTLGSILKPSESLRQWAPWVGQADTPMMTNGGIGGGAPMGPQDGPGGPTQMAPAMGGAPIAPAMGGQPMPGAAAPAMQPRMVRMRSPDGEEADIPEHQVAHFTQKGAQPVAPQMMGGQ